MEPCCAIGGAAIFLVPPFLLCWTAVVVAVRYLSDRPVGLRRTFDAMATGCHLMVIGLFLSFAFAVIAGGVALVPILIFIEHVAEWNIEYIGYTVVPLVMLIAVAVVNWKITRPIVREEWVRLTHTNREFGPKAYERPSTASADADG